VGRRNRPTSIGVPHDADGLEMAMRRVGGAQVGEMTRAGAVAGPHQV